MGHTTHLVLSLLKNEQLCLGAVRGRLALWNISPPAGLISMVAVVYSRFNKSSRTHVSERPKLVIDWSGIRSDYFSYPILSHAFRLLNAFFTQ